MPKVTILGGGSWAMGLAILLYGNKNEGTPDTMDLGTAD